MKNVYSLTLHKCRRNSGNCVEKCRPILELHEATRKLHLLSEKYHRIFGSVAEKLNAPMGLGRKKNGQPFVMCTTKLHLYYIG